MSAARAYSLAKTGSLATHNLRCPLGAAMFSEQAWGEIARSLKLSGKELQIVRGVFDDCTEFTIANNLNVSPHTVHTHCERLYHKLAVTDRVKLVLRVMDEFLALTVAPGSTLPPVCANFATGRCPPCAAVKFKVQSSKFRV
jgi:DNA-binding CsgD family transcriptional regulator